MRRTLVFALALSVFVFAPCYAQGRVTTAEVTVTILKNGPTYAYTYSVRNGVDNSGRICWIDLDVSLPPDSKDISQIPLPDGKGVLKLGSVPGAQAIATVPLSANSPTGWVGAIGLTGALRWMSLDETYEIA